MSAKRTPLTPDELEALAVTYGTPYQLYDEQAMRDNCTALLAAFRAHFGPSFKQFFAVKALPNPAVLRVLVDAGCGLDCSSTSELHIAQALGVAGGDVMYTSNYTSQGDLATAVAQGVIVNLDDASLVASVQRACSGAVPALVSFRLNPGKGRTDSETASNVLGGEHAKFGVPPEQIVEAYRSAKAAGAVRFGMHMMTGSCVLNEEYWLETVGVLVDTVARVQRECGIASFEFINIGGGLGIPYRPEDPVVSVDTLPARIKGVMVARWQAAGNGAQPLPALFMENGRYMTGPYGWLVARCHAIKQAHSSTYYGLDACMANLMRPGMYNSYHHITVPAKEGGAREPSNVVGTLCENNDWFAKVSSSGGQASGGAGLPDVRCCPSHSLLYTATLLLLLSPPPPHRTATSPRQPCRTCLSSTTLARTLTPWGFSTMASCGRQSCCCGRRQLAARLAPLSLSSSGRGRRWRSSFSTRACQLTWLPGCPGATPMRRARALGWRRATCSTLQWQQQWPLLLCWLARGCWGEASEGGGGRLGKG